MSGSNAADSAGRYSEAEEIRRLVEQRLDAIISTAFSRIVEKVSLKSV